MEMFEGPQHSSTLLGQDQHNPVSVCAWLPGLEVLVDAAPDFPGKWSPAENGLVALEKSVLSESAPRNFPATLFSCPANAQLLLVPARPGCPRRAAPRLGLTPGRRGPHVWEGGGAHGAGVRTAWVSVSPPFKGPFWVCNTL